MASMQPHALDQLWATVSSRKGADPASSWTAKLLSKGVNKCAQKVGEEGVELALARMKDDSGEMANEAADLLFHMLVLLQDAGLELGDVIRVLQARHAS